MKKLISLMFIMIIFSMIAFCVINVSAKTYEDLTNKPTIPNVSGFATHQYVKDKIAEAQLNGGGGGTGGTGGSGIIYNEHYESLTINSVQSINYDESNERLNIN